MKTKNTFSEVLEIPLTGYPGINRFALDYVQGSGSARRFLPRPELMSLHPRRTVLSPELAGELIESNLRWGNDVSAQIRRARSEETIVMVAGQQVGFAGGPMYTLAKIASMLSMKKRWESRGVACTVLFWLATEDHDFDEVVTLTLPSPDGAITISAGERSGIRGVVGDMTVPDSLRDEFFKHAQLPAVEHGWLKRGMTFRDSFATLLAEVFKGDGVILIDSLLPTLRKAGSQLFHGLIDSASGLTALVSRRSEELEEAGYKPQVVGREGSLPFLFLISSKGERVPLREAGGTWMAGDESIEAGVLHEIAESEPQRISTGVLTRPLLQDAVFQPSVFVGGPAEVAYYAQIAPLHEKMAIAVPRVVLRGHTLIASERILHTYHRHDLQPRDIFSDPEAIVARLDSGKDQELTDTMVRAREVIERELSGISALVLPADKTLSKSIERSLRRIRYQLARLEERGRSSLVRRNRERFEALRRMSNTLFPRGVPQDRLTAWISYWFQHGRRLVDRMIDETEPDTDRVRIIGL